MREARNAINAKFWPRNAEEALAVAAPDHPLNTAYRQTTGYWEMVYASPAMGSFQRISWWRTTGSPFLFARVEPYVEKIRQAGFLRAFRNAEWAASCDTGIAMMEALRPRIKRTLESGTLP